MKAQESTDSQLRAAKKVLHRARTLLRSSDQLATSKRYVQAQSILILSLEELAKAMFLRLAVEGLFSTEPHGDALLGNLDSSHLRLHWLKQVAIVNLMLALYTRARLNMLFLKFEGREPTESEVDLLVPKVCENSLELPPANTYKLPQHRELWRISRDLGRLHKLLGTLEHQKQSGFYIDVNVRKGTAGSSSRGSATNYKRLRGLANGVFPFVGWFVKYGYSRSGKSHLIELTMTGRTDWSRDPSTQLGGASDGQNSAEG